MTEAYYSGEFCIWKTLASGPYGWPAAGEVDTGKWAGLRIGSGPWFTARSPGSMLPVRHSIAH